MGAISGNVFLMYGVLPNYHPIAMYSTCIGLRQHIQPYIDLHHYLLHESNIKSFITVKVTTLSPRIQGNKIAYEEQNRMRKINYI